MNPLLRAVEPLFFPVGFVWACLIFGFVVFLRKKNRAAGILCGFLALILSAFGCTPASSYLLSRLERPYSQATIANTGNADVILMLGGVSHDSPAEPFGIAMGKAGSRLVTAVELARQRKAPTLVLSGGERLVKGVKSSEGSVLKQLVDSWKTVPGEVLALDACATTRVEAVRFRALMTQRKWTNVILVTSAFHMSRSLETFRKEGIAARPVACDFRGLPEIELAGPQFRVVPTAEAMEGTGVYLHELLGSLYYRLRGWH